MHHDILLYIFIYSIPTTSPALNRVTHSTQIDYPRITVHIGTPRTDRPLKPPVSSPNRPWALLAMEGLYFNVNKYAIVPLLSFQRPQTPLISQQLTPVAISRASSEAIDLAY